MPRRVDILWICRHCSCIPSCRRMFFFSILAVTFEYNRCTFINYLNTIHILWVLGFVAMDLKQEFASGYESAGTAAASCRRIFPHFGVQILLSIKNVLLLTRHEYMLSIGLCGSGFEVGICRHRSCMPSCRRIFFLFWCSNTFEYNKCTCVN